MTYPLRSSVVVVADSLELKLPIGKPGYVLAVNPSPYTLLRYLINVPSFPYCMWVPESDLRSLEEMTGTEADKVIANSLLDYALATRNKSLFDSLFPLKGW
ncbi:ATPase [Cohnella silvisoli]|uniref:ATPase n=1 Tax=Cohnella silvisoli TaxID=2873699 RepID=A0ABV1L274_9BACL|nr:ATPase [Cohnella silvisoli]MCD9025759.1 ATPase [Cohnella silvisoli]